MTTAYVPHPRKRRGRGLTTAQVYKGVLFSVPAVEDKGLRSWIERIGELEGVKAVEEDQVVKIN